ncbi:Putative mycotoxin biosynthesis protein UstYa [Colletotrichum destructivum]|uniref:Mycotoxin biosynthesis protein UstYa n=1 Tax=Colletotrichum destructivum TaxID=34406 RepID=A0AAX4IXB5_9PEZI|nr:Putative mycotoxin biosynthesis protein UstYa [Colletotrichum destructivum]
MKPQDALYSDAHREAEIHDDSMTEVSVSLLSEDGGKQQWKRADIEAGRPTTQPSRCTRICGFFQRWRGLVDTLMLFVIVGLLLERREMQPAPRDKRLEPVGDLTGFAPEFTQQITTFHPTTDFVPDDPKKLFTNASIQENWLSIVPRGLGYVVMQDPAAHDNLPVPLPEFAPRTVFTTSMTHQLHCLYAILESYAGLAVNGSAAVDMHSHIPDGTKGAEGPWHLQHCFEYLRQAIMCAGDVALEGTQTTFPEGFTGSDGWDAKHVCRDYTQVYDYLDKNRALDDHWI